MPKKKKKKIIEFDEVAPEPTIDEYVEKFKQELRKIQEKYPTWITDYELEFRQLDNIPGKKKKRRRRKNKQQLAQSEPITTASEPEEAASSTNSKQLTRSLTEKKLARTSDRNSILRSVSSKKLIGLPDEKKSEEILGSFNVEKLKENQLDVVDAVSVNIYIDRMDETKNSAIILNSFEIKNLIDIEYFISSLSIRFSFNNRPLHSSNNEVVNFIYRLENQTVFLEFKSIFNSLFLSPAKKCMACGFIFHNASILQVSNLI